jgi:glyoxylase-like metal-dependent hydrolase (beta-lactamase superfamily II)
MRIIPLHRESDSDYSCTCYWVLGDNNEPTDRNTLIDAGSSNLANLAHFMHEMTIMSKGIGKMAVEQVVITHEHFDHAGGFAGIDRQFAPLTYAWIPQGSRRGEARDGARIRVGDQEAVLLHTPGHSEDSMCVFLPESGTLFSGDTVFRITDNLGSYPRSYVSYLERLAALDIRAVYPGRGSPILSGALSFIRDCSDNVRRSPLSD